MRWVKGIPIILLRGSEMLSYRSRRQTFESEMASDEGAQIAARTKTRVLIGNPFNLVRTKLYYENNDMQRPRRSLRSEADGRFLE